MQSKWEEKNGQIMKNWPRSPDSCSKFLLYTASAHSLWEEQNGRKKQRQKCGYPRLGLMSNLKRTASLAASLQVGIEHLLQHVRSDQLVWCVSMQALQGCFGVCAQKAALLMLIQNDLSCINTVKNWKAGLQTQRYSQLNTETIACK